MKVYVIQIGNIDWYYLYDEKRTVIAEGTADEIDCIIRENGYTQISLD